MAVSGARRVTESSQLVAALEEALEVEHGGVARRAVCGGAHG